MDCLDAASSAPKPEATYANDAYKVFVGGHYNFDVFRLFGTVQYLKNMPWIGGYSTKEVAPLALGSKGPQKGFEAWAFSTGVDFRAVGGKVMTSVGYAPLSTVSAAISGRTQIGRKKKFLPTNLSLA